MFEITQAAYTIPDLIETTEGDTMIETSDLSDRNRRSQGDFGIEEKVSGSRGKTKQEEEETAKKGGKEDHEVESNGCTGN
jgi:hypothetical protein